MLDVEKIKIDFHEGRAVNPRNVRDLIAEVERLRALLAERDFISVKDKLPERDGKYITIVELNGKPAVETHYYSRVIGWDVFFCEITHWMSFPEA